MSTYEFVKTTSRPVATNQPAVHHRPPSGRSAIWSYDFADPISLEEFDSNESWVHSHQPFRLMLS
jgi:hypothetical protein